MKLIALLALAGLTATTDIKIPRGRIVGGYEVQPSFKYSWLASLQYYRTHMCGGTMYTGNTVISAAHCVGGEIMLWTADIHRHNLYRNPALENGITYAVTDRIVHPEYNVNNDSGNDVAIWKLNGTSTAPTGIKLDTGVYSSTDDTVLKVIGWGATASGEDTTDLLLEVKLPVFNSAKCVEAYPTLDTKSQFCAGYPEGGKDSCQGDSGGPMFIDNDGVTTLVGIVSWGRGCALKGYPGVYTRTSAVADFINIHI